MSKAKKITKKEEKPVKMYVCCHCRKPYAVVPKSSRERTFDENPCDICKPICERKENAEEIYRERKWKKKMSKFGKYLFKLIDDEIKIQKKYGRKTEANFYNPMRYVSEEELTIARKEYGESLCDYYRKGWSGIYVELRKPGLGGYLQLDGWISEPGFYRVSTKRVDGMFVTRCSGGIPSHYACSEMKMFNEKVWREYGEWVEKRRTNDLKKEILKEEISLKKKCFNMYSNRNKDSEAFFRGLAMVGSVKK